MSGSQHEAVLPQGRSTIPLGSILEKLLHPMRLDYFLERHFRREPFASPGAAAQFEGLVDWPLISEIVNSHHPNCWLPHRGKLPANPSLNTGTLTVIQAVFGYTSGHTILIRHAERAHTQLKKIADDFENLFNRSIDIQLYCTPTEEEGFDWHYDVEDVFVIQSKGRKEFRLLKNRRSQPLPHSQLPASLNLAEESEGPEIRCLLHPGDWLYIPAGYWHKAHSLESSFHMSVGVMPKSESPRSVTAPFSH